MHSYYLDAIRNFEGFTPKASWDYAQFSNGYGTRARFDGEVIDQAEADRRFRAEISQARDIVESAAPHIDEGTKAALTSLTYNAGTSWIQSGLGEAVRAGDLDVVRDIFQKYNKAGGEVLPGLVRRRAEEAQGIGNPDSLRVADASQGDRLLEEITKSVSSGTDGDSSAQRVAELIQQGAARAARSADDLARARGAFERAPISEREPAVTQVALARAASEALMVLAEADKLTSERVADLARTAQLGRGSELARAGNDQQDKETRRI